MKTVHVFYVDSKRIILGLYPYFMMTLHVLYKYYTPISSGLYPLLIRTGTVLLDDGTRIM